jgi:hypothetical protein
MFKALALAYFLTALASSSVAQKPPVLLSVSESGSGKQYVKELEDKLSNFRPILESDGAEHAFIYKKMVELFKKSLGPEDSDKTFTLVITDSQDTGHAFIYKPPRSPKHRIVAFSIGTILDAKTDDELISIFGHEAQHPIARINDLLFTKDYKNKANLFERVILSTAAKAEEFEADLGSMRPPCDVVGSRSVSKNGK